MPHTRNTFSRNKPSNPLVRLVRRLREIVTIISLLISYTLQAAAFDIKIDGIEDKVLRKMLNEVAEAEMAEEDNPQQQARLHQIARQHTAALKKLMRAEGYYSATIAVASVTTGNTPQVRYLINPGARFTFNNVTITLIDPENGYMSASPASLSMGKGMPARTQPVLDTMDKLREAALEAGYPHAQMVDTGAIADHAMGIMDIEFKLQSGPFGRLALPTFEGLATVQERALLAKVPWTAGARYRPSLDEQLKRKLLETQLFSIVRISYGDKLGSDGLMPVIVKLTERKHRTLKAGLRFHSDKGPGANIGWQHRNFYGGGELLDLSLDIASDAQVLNVRYNKPDFYRPDQSLLTLLTAEQRSTDAFDSLALDTSIGIGRRLAPKMGASIGVSFRLSDVEQQDEKENYGLLYWPVGFKWDNSDKLLDATRGFRVQLDGAPYTDMFNDGVSFTRLYGRYSHYLKVLDSPRTVLAGRLSLGMLNGSSRDSIPPDIRFYAGGGSSVRGIGFQLASPLDESNDPIGGRSLFEVALETRMRITENIGLVAFVDAGQAYESQYPDFEEDPQFGAGLGMRYHTPIGPLRCDVGVPLDKRPGIDDDFQIYISLGQAF